MTRYVDNAARAQQYADDPEFRAKRKAEQEQYQSRFKNGTVEARTETVVVGGMPVELINGAWIASRYRWTVTRITDWEQAGNIPPGIRIGRVRFYTLHQARLMRQLAKLSPRAPTAQQRAVRDRFIRSLWKRWWE